MPKWNRKGRVVAAASAAATIAAAAYEFEHRHVSRADLTESHVRIQRLWDIQPEKEDIAKIGDGLLAEWGSFAFLGFDSIAEMAAKAGQSIFVAQRRLDERDTQTCVLQTIRIQANGDPALLLEQHSTFADLTSNKSWNESIYRGGDTVVFLQITTLGRQERSAGLGTLLRNAALHMQGSEVKFALTTTPVDQDSGAVLNLEDPNTYTPAMRFHVRGGAKPTLLLPAYKAFEQADEDDPKHASDVVVMRYARGDDGIWPTARPTMRLRRAGPLQQRLALAWRRLRRIKGRRRPQLLHP
jgi:hypothetical protein